MTVLLAPLPPNTMPDKGKSVVLLDAAERVRLATAVSVSPTVKAIALVAVSSLTVWLEMAVMVGASFTAVTVRVNVVEAVPELASVTVIVTVLVPD